MGGAEFKSFPTQKKATRRLKTRLPNNLAVLLLATPKMQVFARIYLTDCPKANLEKTLLSFQSQEQIYKSLE
jgi:hypothetical protein